MRQSKAAIIDSEAYSQVQPPDVFVFRPYFTAELHMRQVCILTAYLLLSQLGKVCRYHDTKHHHQVTYKEMMLSVFPEPEQRQCEVETQIRDW